MIRVLVKLVIAALVANAAWRAGSAYLTFYRFKDAVQEAAQFAGSKSDAELQQRVVELASEYDVPLGDDDVTIVRRDQHTKIAGAYAQPVELVPGYTYQWPFKWSVDAITVTAPSFAPSTPD